MSCRLLFLCAVLPALLCAPATAASVTRADVEAAATCRGLLSAAAASHRVQPDAAKAAGLPLPPANLDIRYMMKIQKRGQAAGLPDADVNALLAGKTRVLSTPEAMKAAAPDVRRCIDEAPSRS